VSEIVVAPASSDDVRAILHRRSADAAGLRLALALVDDGTVWVARDDGEAIGITVAHVQDDAFHVGDLFVEPSYRAQGIGARLFDAALERAGDLARTVLLAPGDAAALVLSLRRRLAPVGTIVRFAGAIPREEELAAMAAGDYRFAVDAIDPVAHAYGLNALDRETWGTTRARDHQQFALAATGQAFFLNGEFVAYAYVWPDGRIGPLASASTAYLVQIFAYALVTLQRRYNASWCTTLVPSVNLRISRTALRAGLRIEDLLLFATDSTIDLSRYVGYHSLMF
jgi:GNAT superfamily N-acetyltransferase